MPEVVELYVVMYCEECASSVKRAVKRIPGVESYKIDYYGQTVTIVGNVDVEDVLRRIRKTGRHVMLIAKPTELKEERKEETKIEETKIEEETKREEEVKVEEITSEGTKVVDTKEEVKVEEVVTVVETKEEEKEEPKAEETKGEAKAHKKKKVQKKEAEKPKEPEWVQMFVTAPYYTLPSRFYN